MPFQKGQNPNRPAPGSSIKVEPIRMKQAIANIKKVLQDKPRDLCLFTLGINTAYRANELLSIKLAQVVDLEVGDTLSVKQSKTKKYRTVVLNRPAVEALQRFVHEECGGLSDSDCIFRGQRGNVLTVPAFTNLVKSWCQAVGLKGNYGSHTLRKTWGYWQYKRGTPLPLLMEAFGHATQQQSLAYLCIQAKEIKQIYDLEL